MSEWRDIASAPSPSPYRQKAAIAAMREPTSKMVDAGDATLYSHRDMEHATEARLADQPWRAMIDAALGRADT